MFAHDSLHTRFELPAGTRVGAWRVESVRARLPHAVVHRARHESSGRLAGLALLRPSAAGPSQRQLTRDLELLPRLRHGHVAEVFETGDLGDGRLYLVVEWIGGHSLQSLLDARRTLSLEETLDLGQQIAAALDAAHALGLVHGELHARHVGLVPRADGARVKLVSFGLARLTGSTLAPEQRSGQCDRRSDVFALGALLYQMVTGLRPHPDPLPPSAAAEVPSGFDEVVRRCLCLDPAQRYDSVEGMMRELTAATAESELVAELQVRAFIDPTETADAAALDDVERALEIAQDWLRRQEVALVLGGSGAVVATTRIPRELEQQRAARAGWVKLASAVQSRVQARPSKHPAVRTKVTIRIDG